MIEIDNISLKEYFELEDKSEHDFIIKYILPKDVFEVGDLTEYPFGLIKDMQYDYSVGITWDQLIDYIVKLTKRRSHMIGKEKLVELAKFKSYLLSELDRINLIESELLGYTPNSEEIQAGIDRFEKFGSYGQLRKLAGDDITKLEEVKSLKYSHCLLELHYQKEEFEYTSRLNDIRYKK